MFLLFIGDEHVRHDRQIGIAIVLECSLPVHQPQAASIEENVVRLEQVVMTRSQVRIERRVSGRYSRVLKEKFLEIVFRQDVRVPELLEEAVQGRPFVQQEGASRIEGGYGKRRQRVQLRRAAGTRRSASVAGKGTASTKSVMEIRSSALAYRTRGASPASAAACMQLK